MNTLQCKSTVPSSSSSPRATPYPAQCLAPRTLSEWGFFRSWPPHLQPAQATECGGLQMLPDFYSLYLPSSSAFLLKALA